MILSFINISQNLNLSLNRNKNLQRIKKSIKGKIIVFIVSTITACIIVLHSYCAYCDSNFKISPDNINRIVWECKTEPHNSSIYTRECKVYAVGISGKKEWIHKESDLPEPTVKWHNNSLAEVTIPCGSPCNYSIFYDVKKGASAPYEFVLAVNADKQIIARAGKSHILINSIFQKHNKIFMKINRRFAETAALVLVIEEAHFTKTGNLYIRYLSGSNYVPKEETIPVKYICNK
jgi:hypothetical protein